MMTRDEEDQKKRMDSLFRLFPCLACGSSSIIRIEELARKSLLPSASSVHSPRLLFFLARPADEKRRPSRHLDLPSPPTALRLDSLPGSNLVLPSLLARIRQRFLPSRLPRRSPVGLSSGDTILDSRQALPGMILISYEF